MSLNEAPPRFGLFLKELGWVPRVMAHGADTTEPQGLKDGPPCMVIPGFLVSDPVTAPLRMALGKAGWRTYGWGLGLNRGAYPGLLDHMARQIDAVRGDRPILLVGWSLGGLYAREVAREFPDKVSRVVTLGSPFGGDDRRANNAWRLYEWVAGHSVDDPPVALHPAKPPVPTLAIWSSKDGLISERAACGIDVECDQSARIDAAHMEMGISPRAIRQIIPIIEKFAGHPDR
nr:alpha/beta fold hydrolase [uncultured Sphingomonas sp.]